VVVLLLLLAWALTMATATAAALYSCGNSSLQDMVGREGKSYSSSS
jgi:hypothetical protein